MIIKGSSTGGAGRIAVHVQSGENERVEVKELRGVMTDNLRDALRQMETAAKCTAARKPLYHASINPRAGEDLKPTSNGRGRSTGLRPGLASTVTPAWSCSQAGREHRQSMWSRIDLDRGRGSRTATITASTKKCPATSNAGSA